MLFRSGANVQIFRRNEQADCQKVIVKYMGDGYYTLTFVHSNMLLDVSNGNTADHTNVWQCRENGADAQKWILKDLGDGYYNIISKLSNTYLTVANGGTANCTNIEINSANGGMSQKFKFNKIKSLDVPDITPKQTIEDGLYEIETKVSSNKVLEVIDASQVSGANVQIFTRNKQADCQKVRVKYLGNGYYTLTFVHSNMLLDVSNGNTADHTNVWQCRENGADAQQWVIVDLGNGYYNIVSKSANKYLTVYRGGTSNCTNIEINSYIGDNSQQFKFNKIEDEIAELVPQKTIEDGIYEIETGVDQNKALEVIDASHISGANVQIYNKNNNAECQRVNVKYLGNGYYTLTFVHSGMLLDVSNGGTDDHTNVWQCRENGADAQQWMILDLNNGYYKIVSKSAKKYLTVANGGTANCTNIEINSKDIENTQKFKFIKKADSIYKMDKPMANIEEGLYEVEIEIGRAHV